MSKNGWIILFFAAWLANVIGSIMHSTSIDYVSKPLISASLVVAFIFSTGTIKSSLKKWVILALFFSWCGDVLLMFQGIDPLFFLLGLSAFLIAHIFYILFFHRLRVLEAIKGRWLIVVIVVAYYVCLVGFLSPYLGEYKLPVRIYGIVISFMLMLALHMKYLKNRVAGQYMLGGALLFVMSDSLLAINKFYHPFNLAGPIIMLTYGAAQFFIVMGAIKYLVSGVKDNFVPVLKKN